MDQISPDLAGKVLTANLRNVVQKVQDGKTLTASEVKTFEQCAVEQAGLLVACRASLIRKWVGGGRLTDDEKEEVAAIIPVESEPRPGSSRTSYRLEQKDYAAIFKTSDRTIKRWVKTGKNAGELPPLDAPAAMPQWWTKYYKQKIPACILDAARSAPPVVVPAAGADETPGPPAAPPAASLDVGMGFQEMLDRVRRAERAAYLKYDEALSRNDESNLPLARKTWSELSKQLRELERDAHDILSRSGALVEKAAVEKTIAEIHVPIVNGVRSMWRRVKAKMLTAAESQQDRVWQDEVDRLFSRLGASGFTQYE